MPPLNLSHGYIKQPPQTRANCGAQHKKRLIYRVRHALITFTTAGLKDNLNLISRCGKAVLSLAYGEFIFLIGGYWRATIA